MRPIKEQARRFRYYAKHGALSLVPNWLYRRRLAGLMGGIGAEERLRAADRVDYYFPGHAPLRLGSDAIAIKDLRHGGRMHSYYYDLLALARHFPSHYRLSYVFGDNRDIPANPSLLRSRPIAPSSPNAALLKLDELRHFNFFEDPTPHRVKSDVVVWRGKGLGKRGRLEFVQRFHQAPGCDVGDVDPKRRGSSGWKPFMSIPDQMKHRFIVSLEGNDVATNLKWIMASNSLCMMPKPRFETWFMEGRLQAGVHYVELRDDCGDLLEARDHYLAHPEEAEAIIANAQRHVAQFRDRRSEFAVQMLVMEKYFRLTGQSVPA